MIGTLAILPDLKRLVMESVRVMLSIVGTKAAEEPNVRFWKALCEWNVSGFVRSLMGSSPMHTRY
jgi:hypothetical protein